MSIGNFLRKISLDTGKQDTSSSSTHAAEVGGIGLNNILHAPGKLLESVNEKTGTLVSDLNQKLDLSGKFDTIKNVSVTKFENVLRRHSSHDEEEKCVKIASPEVSTEDESQQSGKIRRQSTNTTPKPPRPPPPSSAALNRAMSLDERNLSGTEHIYRNPSRKGRPSSDMVSYAEREEEQLSERYSSRRDEEEGDSSASEYGTQGDRPIYKTDAESMEKTIIPIDQDPPKFEIDTSTIMTKYVEALLSDDCSECNRYENDVQHILETAEGRQEFVNKIDREISKGHDVINSRAFPSFLDRIGSLLTECQEEEDFGPAKKLLQTSLQLKVVDPTNPSGEISLFECIKDQPIWQSLRFWNACFFQSIQEARAKTTEQEMSDSELEQISYKQLQSYLTTMNVFNLHVTIKQEFLRKHSNLFNLSDDHVQLLRGLFKQQV